MTYIYEIDLNGLDLEDLKNFLKERNIKYDIEKGKIKVYLEDYYFVYKFDKFIKAIKANFDIKLSSNILYNDWDVIEIDLKKAVNKKINHLIRIKGRIIGENGKALQEIMFLSGAYIKIDNRYIYILGDHLSIETAYEVIKRIVSGAKHTTSYRFAEEYKKILEDKEKEASRYNFQDENF